MAKLDGKAEPVMIPPVMANDLEILIGERIVASNLPLSHRKVRFEKFRPLCGGQWPASEPAAPGASRTLGEDCSFGRVFAAFRPAEFTVLCPLMLSTVGFEKFICLTPQTPATTMLATTPISQNLFREGPPLRSFSLGALVAISLLCDVCLSAAAAPTRSTVSRWLRPLW